MGQASKFEVNNFSWTTTGVGANDGFILFEFGNAYVDLSGTTVSDSATYANRTLFIAKNHLQNQTQTNKFNMILLGFNGGGAEWRPTLSNVPGPIYVATPSGSADHKIKVSNYDNDQHHITANSSTGLYCEVDSYSMQQTSLTGSSYAD